VFLIKLALFPSYFNFLANGTAHASKITPWKLKLLRNRFRIKNGHMFINWIGFGPQLIDISEFEHANINNSERESTNIDN